jgi:hypothetical protein
MILYQSADYTLFKCYLSAFSDSIYTSFGVVLCGEMLLTFLPVVGIFPV